MDISEKHIIKQPDVLYREIESKSVLLNLNSGTYYTLNRTGTFIWSVIDEQTSINHIVGKVVEKYDVSQDTALKDVHALIADLVNEGLVEIADEPA